MSTTKHLLNKKSLELDEALFLVELGFCVRRLDWDETSYIKKNSRGRIVRETGKIWTPQSWSTNWVAVLDKGQIKKPFRTFRFHEAIRLMKSTARLRLLSWPVDVNIHLSNGFFYREDNTGHVFTPEEMLSAEWVVVYD